MNLNKVFLLGNLTADPEIRTTPSGKSVCRFRMATNRFWVDRQSGEKKQSVEYHSVVAWDKLANIVSQYLSKGRLVFVEGRLVTRTWEDGSGNKRSRTEIIAENIQLGPRFGQSASQEKPPTPSQTPPAPEEEIPIIEEGEDINVDEIPF
ncbi:single-stranded DNA-binding protein [bacterium]|nr:single-stranded DNA-binding protein [bacterium]